MLLEVVVRSTPWRQRHISRAAAMPAGRVCLLERSPKLLARSVPLASLGGSGWLKRALAAAQWPRAVGNPVRAETRCSLISRRGLPGPLREQQSS